MTPQVILFIILSITAISFVADQVLDYLNLRALRTDIPPEVASFYDPARYAKALEYHRVTARFSFVTSSLSFVASFTMLALGGFGWVDGLLRPYVDSPVVLALLFFGVILVTTDILSLPFQLYSIFVIEERFGFNKTTPKTFVLDKLKGYLLGAVIGGSLLALLIYLANALGPTFWIWFGVAASGFIVLMNLFYTTLLLPMFNKLSVLPEGQLKTAIETFSRKVSFPIDNVFVIDGSKRSTKANAFFSGLGKRKKVILYDTLIEKHTTDELVAVLAHEVGHYKKKHIILSIVLSLIQVFFVLFVLSLMIYSEGLSMAMGGSAASIHLNLIAFAILFTPVSAVTGLLMILLSRKNEYEADDYARKEFSGPALAAALKRLSVDTLSNLYPHPAYVFFHYSHPPLLKRLKALNVD